MCDQLHLIHLKVPGSSQGNLTFSITSFHFSLFSCDWCWLDNLTFACILVVVLKSWHLVVKNIYWVLCPHEVAVQRLQFCSLWKTTAVRKPYIGYMQLQSLCSEFGLCSFIFLKQEKTYKVRIVTKFWYWIWPKHINMIKSFCFQRNQWSEIKVRWSGVLWFAERLAPPTNPDLYGQINTTSRILVTLVFTQIHWPSQFI